MYSNGSSSHKTWMRKRINHRKQQEKLSNLCVVYRYNGNIIKDQWSDLWDGSGWRLRFEGYIWAYIYIYINVTVCHQFCLRLGKRDFSLECPPQAIQGTSSRSQISQQKNPFSLELPWKKKSCKTFTTFYRPQTLTLPLFIPKGVFLPVFRADRPFMFHRRRRQFVSPWYVPFVVRHHSLHRRVPRSMDLRSWICRWSCPPEWSDPANVWSFLEEKPTTEIHLNMVPTGFLFVQKSL